MKREGDRGRERKREETREEIRNEYGGLSIEYSNKNNSWLYFWEAHLLENLFNEAHNQVMSPCLCLISVSRSLQIGCYYQKIVNL